MNPYARFALKGAGVLLLTAIVIVSALYLPPITAVVIVGGIVLGYLHARRRNGRRPAPPPQHGRGEPPASLRDGTILRATLRGGDGRVRDADIEYFIDGWNDGHKGRGEDIAAHDILNWFVVPDDDTSSQI